MTPLHLYTGEHPLPLTVCIMAKHKEAPRLPRDSKFEEQPLARLHIDILTLPMLADDRFKYALVVVDEATNYVYTKPCVTKDDCAQEVQSMQSHASLARWQFRAAVSITFPRCIYAPPSQGNYNNLGLGVLILNGAWACCFAKQMPCTLKVCFLMHAMHQSAPVVCIALVLRVANLGWCSMKPLHT